MGEKLELFLTVDYYLINVEVTMAIENHSLSTITEAADIARGHQWMRKLMCRGLKKYLPPPF